MNALDNGLFDQCQQENIIPVIRACLGGGHLFTEANEMTQSLKKPTLQSVSKKLGVESGALYECSLGRCVH